MNIGNVIKIGNKKIETYKGLIIRADEFLHAQIATAIQENLPKGSKILDLGCGQGALSLRLHDLGYELLAVDVNPSDFLAKGIPYEVCNFNSNQDMNAFIEKHSGSFDCVLGVEVIEHLENPWEYLRTLNKMVKKSGFVVLTTPNITSWYSRSVFFLTGLFPGFVDPDECGHINPISEWEIKVIADKVGFKVKDMRPAGNLPYIWINSSIVKTLINFIFLPYFFIMRGKITGWCKLVILQKL
jgi:2-polyprenyl-3-methyl-5-hydroxy-6-metoxy-1,4-benzoquinol methylase